MRRAIIAIATAAALTLTGLTLWPSLRASALGETSVTLSCTDGTSVKLLVDAEALAGLTAALQGMIDYPAGLSCTLIQNPLTTSFGNIAVAATTNTFVVAGGRWLVECADIFPEPVGTTLTVIKDTVNDNPNEPGTAVSEQFTITVTGSAVPTGTITFQGQEAPGTTIPMQPGNYTVTETAGPSGYNTFTSGDCTSTLAAGENKTCTVTNNDIESSFISPADQLASAIGKAIASSVGSRSASLLISPKSLSFAAPTDCDTPCIWVNIAVNLHYRDGTNVLQGTINETIPEHQFCPNPVAGQPDVAVGPSHFTSKPIAPEACLAVNGDFAATRTTVTQISGLPFPPGFPQLPGSTFVGLQPGDEVNFSFFDAGNPSQWTDGMRDMLSGPPESNTPNCPANAPIPLSRLEHGNINVHP